MYTQKKMSKVLLCLAALVVLVGVSAAQAPQSEPELEACITDLRPCRPFAHSTTTRPPTVCCEPLERVRENNVTCLCMMLDNDEVIRSLELNITKALTLFERCGLQPFDLSSDCQGVPSMAPSLSPANAPGSVAASNAPSPSVSTTANPPISGRDDSGASNIGWTGSAILGSFLLCATLMMFY